MKSKFPIKHCPMCGDKLKGRKDKVFCSLECKNAYHRERRHQHLPHTKLIDAALHRNWTILAEFHETIGKNKFHVPMSDLLNSGFKTEYHTSTKVNNKGKLYNYVYNYGWMQFSEKEVLVVHSRRPT